MTKNEALSLRAGDSVIVRRSDRLKMPREVEKVVGQVVKVVHVEDYHGDVMLCFEGGKISLYWDEVDFVQPPCIDEELDAGLVVNVCDLFGGGVS